jgi:hypothetical protein
MEMSCSMGGEGIGDNEGGKVREYTVWSLGSEVLQRLGMRME